MKQSRLALVAVALLLAGCGDKTASHSPPVTQRPTAHRVQRVPSALRLPAQLPTRAVTLPILMYHRIDAVEPTLPAITQRLTVDPGEFARQMAWLERSGFHTVTQRQIFLALERGVSLPRRPVLITFDDGYRDVLGKASPVLARLHMHATAYVITGRISGRDSSFLTWPELRLLERRGVEIGSHTVDHAELTALSDARAGWELRASRAALERHLGHPVQWFAYPAGAEDGRIVALVRRAGYVLAVTTHPGTVQSASAPLELRRLEVLDSTSVAELAAMLGRVGAQ